MNCNKSVQIPQIQQLHCDREKAKPVVKWTGGKYEEFKHFSRYIPSFENYYEPFFGGGGVFFALQPKGKSYLNDISNDLIRFYKKLPTGSFQRELWTYVDAWEQAGVLAGDIDGRLTWIIKRYLRDGDNRHLAKHMENVLYTLNHARYQPLFDKPFILRPNTFVSTLRNTLLAKCNKLRERSSGAGAGTALEKTKSTIETAVKGALYTHMRLIMNDNAAGEVKISSNKALTNWYFIRELCYASMFRYNGKGLFNIPYGGMSYNRKNMRDKVRRICSATIQTLLSKATISNEDFEDFLIRVQPTKKDFIFLDPPFDSAFCEYDKNPFTKADHVRLRNVLSHLSAKWLLVLQKTPFIQSLYSPSQYHIREFQKSYRHNIKGRHQRTVTHLLIMNYDMP